MTHSGQVIGALMRRAINEVLRVPGAAIPGVLAPAIFMIGLSGVFGAATALGGYSTEEFRTFIVPVAFLQSAGFSGAATGVNLARDIEQGWFDRLLLAPVARPVLLAGFVASASLRSFMPASFLLAIALAIGVDWPGLVGLVITFILVAGLAAIAACWSTMLALRFRSQQAAPLMQVGVFASILFTTAYAPLDQMSNWLAEIARLNPVTNILEGVRQGFVADVTWADTWPALLSVAGMLAVLGALAVRGMKHTGS